VEGAGGPLPFGDDPVVKAGDEMTVDLLPTKSREQVYSQVMVPLLEWTQVAKDLVGDLAGGDDPEPVPAGCVDLRGPYD